MEIKELDLSRWTNKKQFIAEYIQEAMKDHGLPYGMAYMNLLMEKYEEAEKLWKTRRT